MQVAELKNLIERDRKLGFDYTQAPLMRVTVAILGDQCYKIVFSHHHLLVDGWSLQLLIRDLLEYYKSIASDMHPYKKNIDNG